MTTMIPLLSRSVRSIASRSASVRCSLPIGSTSLVKRSYHENIVDHYENPRNVGSLDKNDDNVGTVSLLLRFVLHIP